MDVSYDLIVVGSGLLGSSAAYHASKTKDIKIAHIGPTEPEVRSRIKRPSNTHKM